MYINMYMYMYMLITDPEGRRKKPYNNKAQQHNTPKAVNNELPLVGFKPTTLYTYTLYMTPLSTPAPKPSYLLPLYG